MEDKPKIITIVGPTASGKTSLAIELAKRFDGEVISADSRQVYKGLDIGTAKVTPEEMAGVPHHLVDIVEPTKIYTATEFKQDATTTITTLLEHKKQPIITGGTFFYIELLRGTMQPAPVPPNPKFRESLEQFSNQELLEKIRQKDPRRAEAIDPNNRRRLVRALEIIDALGSVPKPKETTSPYEWLILGLKVESEILREKFANRFNGWLEAGLLDEVKKYRTLLSPERFSELGFEYTLSGQYLDGIISKEQFQEQFVQKNWQYAKRQMTWLKKDPSIQWFGPNESEAVFNEVTSFLQQ